MFGLAIWDVVHQRLVLARDAMGVKLITIRLITASSPLIGNSCLFLPQRIPDRKSIRRAEPVPPFRYTPSP